MPDSEHILNVEHHLPSQGQTLEKHALHRRHPFNCHVHTGDAQICSSNPQSFRWISGYAFIYLLPALTRLFRTLSWPEKSFMGRLWRATGLWNLPTVFLKGLGLGLAHVLLSLVLSLSRHLVTACGSPTPSTACGKLPQIVPDGSIYPLLWISTVFPNCTFHLVFPVCFSLPTRLEAHRK